VLAGYVVSPCTRPSVGRFRRQSTLMGLKPRLTSVSWGCLKTAPTVRCDLVRGRLSGSGRFGDQLPRAALSVAMYHHAAASMVGPTGGPLQDHRLLITLRTSPASAVGIPQFNLAAMLSRTTSPIRFSRYFSVIADKAVARLCSAAVLLEKSEWKEYSVVVAGRDAFYLQNTK